MKVTLSEKYLVSVCSEYNHVYLLTPVYSPGRPWRKWCCLDRPRRRWRCLRSTWSPSALSTTTYTFWPLCTLQVACDEGDAVWEVPGLRLLWVQPRTPSDPCVLFRSPVTKVTLSEKYLVSVCSEYNHVYLLTPVYSSGRLWRRWRCLRSTWCPSALSTTTCAPGMWHVSAAWSLRSPALRPWPASK